MWVNDLFVLVFVILIKNSICEKYILIQDDKGYHEFVDLDIEKELPESRLEPNEINFYYYSDLHQTPIKLQVGSAQSALRGSDFDPDRQTYLIVHGWHNDNTSSLNQLVGTAILGKEKNINLLVTDWKKAASGFYTVARIAVPVVGQTIASFVTELSLDTSRLTIIGHSLGAHAAGIAGAALSQNLGLPAQIIGLDPALPLFELTEEDGRLDPTDSKLVHIIHTCAGFLGFLDTIGHVDYYTGEGGKSQPGCSPDPLCVCAHGRSYQYYAESIRTGGFTATKCDSYEDFLSGKCNNNERSHMGGLHFDTKENGSLLLT